MAPSNKYCLASWFDVHYCFICNSFVLFYAMKSNYPHFLVLFYAMKWDILCNQSILVHLSHLLIIIALTQKS